MDKLLSKEGGGKTFQALLYPGEQKPRGKSFPKLIKRRSTPLVDRFYQVFSLVMLSKKEEDGVVTHLFCTGMKLKTLSIFMKFILKGLRLLKLRFLGVGFFSPPLAEGILRQPGSTISHHVFVHPGQQSVAQGPEMAGAVF